MEILYKDLPLDKILTSIDNTAFLNSVDDALKKADQETQRFFSVLENGDNWSHLSFIQENFVLAVTGTFPVKIYLDTLVKFVAERISEVVDVENPNFEKQAQYLTYFLVQKALEKSRTLVCPEGFASSLVTIYPVLVAIMNCGLFKYVTEDSVFLHVLGDYGYSIDRGGKNG